MQYISASNIQGVRDAKQYISDVRIGLNSIHTSIVAVSSVCGHPAHASLLAVGRTIRTMQYISDVRTGLTSIHTSIVGVDVSWNVIDSPARPSWSVSDHEDQTSLMAG